jgi:hypothetical protein
MSASIAGKALSDDPVRIDFVEKNLRGNVFSQLLASGL